MFRLILLLLLPAVAFSQSVSLKGKLVDSQTNLPLEAATVYITSVKDSTTIDYTISDKSGDFVMRLRSSNQPFYLKTSYIGFKDYVRRFEGIQEAIDVGTLKIDEAGNTIDEVVVKAEAPPVRIKSDTLEFNAASFKVKPDANVETLLKQLPGVEIDSDGKITVNGKEVNQILVNGKPFFDKDGKVALQNLPSDIISKVQVSDTKSEKEKITGSTASSNNASINLTIDEDKNKGFFGKVMGGFGTDDRYESSLMVNYFKGSQKISVLGSMNNINSTGFTMNEVFDSMGGGRNSSVWMGDNGSFSINGMQFGGGAGITRSGLIGINFADEWTKEFSSTTNYFYNSAQTENKNRTRLKNLLPEGTFTTNSSRDQVREQFGHNAGAEFTFKPDSLTTITFQPKIIKGRSWNESVSSDETINEQGRLVRESAGLLDRRSENNGLENSFNAGRALGKKGRFVNLYAYFKNDRVQSSARDVSDNFFYTDTDNDGITDQTQTDNRNQIRLERDLTDTFRGEFEWTEPVADSLNLKFQFEYNHDQNVNDRRGFDFDTDTNGYDDFNDLLTNYMMASTRAIVPKVGLGIERSKLSLNLTAGSAVYNFKAQSDYLGTRTSLRQSEIFPSANVWGGYRFTKSKALWMNYNFDVNYPSAVQVLPVEDLSSPLNTTVGNPDLAPRRQHYGYLSFRDYNFATKSGYSIYGGGTYWETDIASSTVFDETRRSVTTFENVNGNLNTWFGANWNKTFKRDAHSLRLQFSVNGNYGINKGYVNQELYQANSISFTPRANLTYNFGELLTVNPSYSFTNSTTNYDNYVISEQSNVVHRGMLQVTSYWPKKVVLGTDLNYTYNSNIADGFKKDFYLLNVSLGYNFLNDAFLAKVKVYDLLDQNQNTTRSIGATSITDQENTVLKRYVMFSLTYKLTKFGGKEKKSGPGFWEH